MVSGKAVTYTSTGSDFKNIVSSTDFEIDVANIKDDEFVLKALASPVNPSDILHVSGIYPSPHSKHTFGGKEVNVVGNEGLFEVTHIGKSVTNYKVGDWVIPKRTSFGTLRTHAVVSTKEDDYPVIVVSSDNGQLTLDQAATIAVNPATAYQILGQFIDDWTEGDWIIQNAGTSQVSKYVTQLAKLKGVKVLSIVRKGKSASVIDELYSFGATKVVDDEELVAPDFQSKLKEWTQGGRVRLALDSVGGPKVSALVEALSPQGKLVVYGCQTGQPITYSSALQLFKDISTHAYWLSENTRRNPKSKIDTTNAIVELYTSGKLKNVPFNKLNFDADKDDFKSVFLKIVEEQHKGKHVVIYN